MTNATPLTISADNTAVALVEIKNLWGAMSTLSEFLKTGRPLDAQVAQSICAVSEYYLADLVKALGVETNGSKAMAERNVLLRAANARVSELQRQVGKTVSPLATQMQIKNLAEQLDSWWRHEGFGHISEVNFGQYGCDIKFSCHMFGNFRLTQSKTPVSDKSRKELWHESLVERGFVLDLTRGDESLVDCENSRNALLALMALRLPSGTVRSLVNSSNREKGFSLREIHVYVKDISDIAALPKLDAADESDA